MTHRRQAYPPPAYRIDANPEQVAKVQAVFEGMRETVMAQEGGEDPWVTFPKWKAAIDALPNLGPLCVLAPEFRRPILDALVAVGVELPDSFRSPR